MNRHTQQLQTKVKEQLAGVLADYVELLNDAESFAKELHKVSTAGTAWYGLACRQHNVLLTVLRLLPAEYRKNVIAQSVTAQILLVIGEFAKLRRDSDEQARDQGAGNSSEADRASECAAGESAPSKAAG